MRPRWPRLGCTDHQIRATEDLAFVLSDAEDAWVPVEVELHEATEYSWTGGDQGRVLSGRALDEKCAAGTVRLRYQG